MPGARYSFGPVRNIQLAINTGRVSLDGTRRNNELLGDLLIGSTECYEMENFELPLA